MTAIVFDAAGEKRFETGVSKGVLYPLNTSNGLYDNGFGWNGLTAVNEKPAGAAPNVTYADNIKYATLFSAETFGGTIQAYTYPNEFAECDGSVETSSGVVVGQQPRKTFGLSYQTKVGDDQDGNRGYKLHLVYGATASPSERDYASVNDSPAPLDFSWDFTSIATNVTSHEPSALITIDSTLVDADVLGDLEDLLYGTIGTDPSLPSPDTVIAMFGASITAITLSPVTFNGTHTVTIPTQTGVTYYQDGVEHASGTVTLTTGQTKVYEARANIGYVFNTPVVTKWLFTFVS